MSPKKPITEEWSSEEIRSRLLLVIAREAVKLCPACRAGIPFKMCPRRPTTWRERIRCILKAKWVIWDVAHFDMLYCYEHAATFRCEAMDHIGHLIKGTDKRQNPIFEDGYEDVWINLTDELDDEEGDGEDNADEIPGN